MTENMAGRGEGLKERIAELWNEASVGEHVHTTETENMDYCRICWSRGAARNSIMDLMPEILAALEAAAPPSTAGQDFEQLVWRANDLLDRAKEAMECDPEADNVGGDCWTWIKQTEIWLEELNRGAALATPSPQAPAHAENCNSALFNGPMGECDCQFKDIPPRSEDLQVFVDEAREQVRSKGIADWVDLRNLLRVIDSMKYEAATAQRPDVATPGESWRENAAATPAQEQSVGRENE